MITLLLAATLATTFPIEHLHEPHTVASVSGVRDIAKIGPGVFVMIAGPHDEAEGGQLTGVAEQRAVPLVALPPKRSRICHGERVITGRDGSWWFARCNDDAIEFVLSDDPSKLRSVRTSAEAIGFAAVVGGDAAAVVLTHRPVEHLIRAEVVTPKGTEPLGEFRRSGNLGYASITVQAHRLADGGIALVTLEEEGREDYAAILRVFRRESMSEHRLPFPRRRHVMVMSGASEHGLGVVLSHPTGGGLSAMVVDPNDPLSAKPHEIDHSDAPYVARRGSQVVPLGQRFAVAWSNANDHSVRMSEFWSEMALPAVRVADTNDVRAFAPMLHAETEGLSVFWAQGAVMQRTLPPNAAGYLVAIELWQRLR
jgi:hypothetical protein